MFTLGVITGAHGIKGDVKVFPFTDNIKWFETLDRVSVDINGIMSEYEIERVWYHKKYVCLKLLGVNTMNDALLLKGAHIKINEQLAAPLEDGEYFVRDLLGMQVLTDGGELLGEITDVIETGANDVYEINGKLLIPAIKDCILNIDTEANKMTVHLLDGLV